MVKLRYKTFAIILTVVFLAALFAGCGGGSTPMPTPDPSVDKDMQDVTGSCKLERNGNDLTVTGETNLINGSIIYVSIHAQSGMELDSWKLTKTEDTISHTFQITDEYDDSVEKVYAFITCAPKLYGVQSDAVYGLYGKKFEYINNKQEGSDEAIFNWNNEGIIVTFMSEPIDM